MAPLCEGAGHLVRPLVPLVTALRGPAASAVGSVAQRERERHEGWEVEVEWRAQFDADATFANGGDLHVRGFRLDVPGRDVTAQQIATLFVRSLGLLMVDRVTVTGLELVAEPHKGSRGGPSDPVAVRPPDGAPARLVELSHRIDRAMVTYPGLPGPKITPYLTREASRSHYAQGTEFAIDSITLVGNTGTYLDSPFHRHAGAADLAGLPLERLADLPAVVVRTAGSGHRGVDVHLLEPYDVTGCAVLVHTGWDAHWRTPGYGTEAPYVTADACRWLVDQGATLVGIDSVNIDDTDDPTRPAHTLLLAAGIPIVEHLTGLAQLPVQGARFTAAPPLVAGLGTFPVRAFAVVPPPVPPEPVDPVDAPTLGGDRE